jgi:hypothetical protein
MDFLCEQRVSKGIPVFLYLDDAFTALILFEAF